MSTGLAYSYCPYPYTDSGSSGVSPESEQLSVRRIEILTSVSERTQESKLSRIKKAIDTLKKLNQTYSIDDWDGRGALAIPVNACEEAVQLILQLPDKYTMPEIIPETTGEVGLEWYVNPYQVLLLSLAGNGYIYFSGLFGYKNTEYGSKPIAGQLDTKIISLLDEVTI